jgi:hypothetical protein
MAVRAGLRSPKGAGNRPDRVGPPGLTAAAMTPDGRAQSKKFPAK